MSLLLLLLVATIFLILPMLPFSLLGRVVADVMLTLILFVGVLASAEHRKIVPTLIVLSILVIVVRGAGLVVPSTSLPVLLELSSLLALLVLAISVGLTVFGEGKDIGARLVGAVVLYMLIGFTWAVAYEIVYNYSPGAFTGAVGGAGFPMGRWVYFSFITLTTVGYGDITPVARAARSLSILEALVGQLYPAVILARLVSLPRDGPPPSGDTQG